MRSFSLSSILQSGFTQSRQEEEEEPQPREAAMSVDVSGPTLLTSVLADDLILVKRLLQMGADVNYCNSGEKVSSTI